MTRKRTKKNPADATIRNVRASRKRDEALSRRVKRLEQWCEMLTLDVDRLTGAMFEVHPNYSTINWDKAVRRAIQPKRRKR